MDVNKYSPNRVKGLLSSSLNANQCDSSVPNSNIKRKDVDLKKFMQRIETFTGLNWFAKPLWLSAPVCARYGWQNVQADWLQCVTCRAFLSGTMPASHKPKAYNECCAKLRESLTGAHHRFCRWPNNPSPETFLQIPTINIEDFRIHLENLIALSSNLPKLDDEKIAQMEISEDELSKVQQALTYPQTDEIFNTAVILAICGWRSNSASSRILHCEYCKREAGLWSFFSLGGNDRLSDDEEEEEEIVPMKKQLHTCSENETRLRIESETQPTSSDQCLRQNNGNLETDDLSSNTICVYDRTATKSDQNERKLLPIISSKDMENDKSDHEGQENGSTKECTSTQRQESEPFQIHDSHSEQNGGLDVVSPEHEDLVPSIAFKQQTESNQQQMCTQESEVPIDEENKIKTDSVACDSMGKTVFQQNDAEADSIDQPQVNQNNNNKNLSKAVVPGNDTGNDVNSDVSDSAEEDVYENDTIGEHDLDETSSSENINGENFINTVEGETGVNSDSLESSPEDNFGTSLQASNSDASCEVATGDFTENREPGTLRNSDQNEYTVNAVEVETQRSAEFISDDEDLSHSEILEHLPSDSDVIAEEGELSSNDDIVIHDEGSDNSVDNNVSPDSGDESVAEDDYDAQGSEAEEIDLEAPSPGDPNEEEEMSEEDELTEDDEENDGDVEDEMDATLDDNTVESTLDEDVDNEDFEDEEKEHFNSSEINEADISTENTNQNNPNSDPIVVIDSSSEEEEQETGSPGPVEEGAGSTDEEDVAVEFEEDEGEAEDASDEDEDEVEFVGEEEAEENDQQSSSEDESDGSNRKRQVQTFRHTYSTLMQQQGFGEEESADLSLATGEYNPEDSDLSHSVDVEQSMVSNDSIGDTVVADAIERSNDFDSKFDEEESDDVVVESDGEAMDSEEDIVVHSPGQEIDTDNLATDEISTVDGDIVTHVIQEDEVVIDNEPLFSAANEQSLFQETLADEMVSGDHTRSIISQSVSDGREQQEIRDNEIEESYPSEQSYSIDKRDETGDMTPDTHLSKSDSDNVDVTADIDENVETTQSELLQVSEKAHKNETSMRLQLDASDQDIEVENDMTRETFTTTKQELILENKDNQKKSIPVFTPCATANEIAFYGNDTAINDNKEIIQTESTSTPEDDFETKDSGMMNNSMLLGADIALHSPDVSLDGIRTPMSQSSASLAQVFNQSRASTPDGQFSECSQVDADIEVGTGTTNDSNVNFGTNTIPRKRKRGSARSYFDPLGEHRSWCAWVTSAEKLGATKGIKRRNTEHGNVLPGWKIVLQMMTKQHIAQDSRNSGISELIKTNASSDGMRRVLQLLEDCTSPNVTLKET